MLLPHFVCQERTYIHCEASAVHAMSAALPRIAGWILPIQDLFICLSGDKITVVITKVELDQCRILLSLKQTQQDPIKENLDTLMPLDINTISDLQWENSGNPLPELEGIVQELKNESKVDSVEFGRLAEAPRAVSQVNYSMLVSIY